MLVGQDDRAVSEFAWLGVVLYFPSVIILFCRRFVTHADRLLAFARQRGAFRTRDLEKIGVPRVVLRRLYRDGLLERVDRGVYMLADGETTEHHTLVEASLRAPSGVICLLSALRFHDLTTQNPSEVWIAIEQKSRRPLLDSIPHKIVYMSSGSFTAGIETHSLEGVDVQLYSASKTVVDCFKYRSRIGIDVAIEALQDYRRSSDYDSDSLWQFAKICRMTNVMRPYLEAIG